MDINKNTSIFQAFTKICSYRSLKEVFIFKKNNVYSSITYEKLYEHTLAFASFLRDKKIDKNTSVILILENSPIWPEILFALSAIGATLVPINPEVDQEEMLNCILHSESKYLITSTKLYQRLQKTISHIQLNTIILDDVSIQNIFLTHIKTDFFPADTSSDDTAVIIYTSGTTATPKGVILTHKNLLSNCNSLVKLGIIISPNDCIAAILPFYHSYPLMVTILLPILTGAKISFPESMNSQHLIDCIKKTGVTIFIGVPRIFEILHERIKVQLNNIFFIKRVIIKITFLLSKPLRKYFKINTQKLILSELHKTFGKQLRLMISGGAKLKPKIIKSFYEWGFTLLEGYGLTEASPVISNNFPNNYIIGSVGKALPDIKIKINTPDKNLIGEIIVKGDNITPGYFKETDLSKKTIKNGWLFTQDLGYIDKKGFLYVTGRVNEMIVLGSGKNINPQDIESRYKRSPFISNICVFNSMPDKNNKSISGLEALIYPDYKFFKSKKIIQIKERILWEIETISRVLPSFKRIQKYKVTKTPLPKTALGKIKRHKVLEMYQSIGKQQINEYPISFEDKELLSIPICKKAYEFIKKKTKKQINLDDNLEIGLEMDSLEQIGLLLDFEQICGVTIDEQELLTLFTVRDILLRFKEAAGKNTSVDDSISELQKNILIPNLNLNKTIDINQSSVTLKLNYAVIFILKTLSKIFCFLKVIGLENIPEKGPFIICPNHTSFLDGPLLAGALNKKTTLQTYFLGLSSYFDIKVISWLKKHLRFISLDPGTNLNQTLETCRYVLNQNKVLCIFPEGMRSIDGEIRELKRGVGILIKELNTPIIPVYIDGTYKLWPAFKKLPRPGKTTIIFGKKLTLNELIKNNPDYIDIHKEIVDNLKEEISKLKKNLNGV